MKTSAFLSALLFFAVVSCKKLDQEIPPKSTSPKDSVAVSTADTLGTQPEAQELTTDEGLLAAFYSANEKKAQLFTINTLKDTTIVCAEKTKITFKANSFVETQTDKDVRGTVRIVVKEYYTISDILLAKLSTTTNGLLLETGGMLYISASAGDERCRLKPEKAMTVAFPRKKEKEGMQVYNGRWNEAGINWQLSKFGNPNNLNQTFSAVDEMPLFPGGINKFYQFISKNFDLGDVEGTHRLIVAFTIDQEGNATNPRILRGINRAINAEALRVIRKLPKFTPAKINGVPVKFNYTVPISITGEYPIEPDGKAYQKDFEEQYNNSNLKTAEVNDINYYLFSTSELGYINCDRLWKSSTAPSVDYAVTFDNNSQAVVNLVFHRYKSIMVQSTENKDVAFKNIPSGEKVTVLAIKYIDKQSYMAVKETVVTSVTESHLAFKPVTMEALKKEMEKLNRFN